MFSTSVLESRKSLDSAASIAEDGNEGESKAGANGRKSLRRSGPGLFPSDKENWLSNSEEQLASTPIKKSGTVWSLLRQVDQLKEELTQEEKRRAAAEAQLDGSRGAWCSVLDARVQLESQAQRVEELQEQCMELEKLRKAARDEATRSWAAAKEFEAKLVEERQGALAERNRAALEIEKLKGELQMRQVPRGFQVSEKLAELEELQQQLLLLSSSMAGQKKRLRKLQVRQQPSERDSGKLDLLEHQRVVSRVVHGAIVKSLVSESSGNAELEAVRAELVKAHAEAEVARAEEKRGLEETREREAQYDIEVAGLRSDVAKLQMLCAEERASARWQQSTQGVEVQRETFQAVGCSMEEGALLDQNRELMSTVVMLKQEVKSLEAEQASLRKTVASLEESLEAVSGVAAELAGHANPKQKIRHLVQLKEENDKLREEKRMLSQRMCHLEANLSTQVLMDELAVFSGSRSSARMSRRISTSTPASRSSKASAARQRFGVLSEVTHGSQLHNTEAERRCQQLERDLEHVNINFRHLVVLVERALSPPVGSSGDDSSLLQRLRAQARSR